VKETYYVRMVGDIEPVTSKGYPVAARNGDKATYYQVRDQVADFLRSQDDYDSEEDGLIAVDVDWETRTLRVHPFSGGFMDEVRAVLENEEEASD
jgi:hypothetical protein